MFFKSCSMVLFLVVSCSKGLRDDYDSTTSALELKIMSNFFQKYCQCLSEWQCECCAKIDKNRLNIHQKLCADWIVVSRTWDISVNVRLNDRVLYTNKFSAWQIPPFCVPIYPPLTLTGCLQLHSVGHHEFNTLYACGNITINIMTFNLINWPIGCVDIGSEGIQMVEPNHAAINSTTRTEIILPS